MESKGAVADIAVYSYTSGVKVDVCVRQTHTHPPSLTHKNTHTQIPTHTPTHTLIIFLIIWLVWYDV